MERRQTGQDERSPSARNLVLVFLASVAVCAVFFSLGFLIGYNQRESKQIPVSENVSGSTEIPPPVNAPVQSSAPASDGESAASSAPAAAPPPATPQTIQTAPAETEPPVKPTKRHASKPARTEPPSNAVSGSAEGRTYSTGYSVQVMAARTEADANSLKNVLKSRGYLAFVLSPQAVGANDNYFRVLVGPFTDRADALKTRDKLEKEGFKPFIKH